MFFLDFQIYLSPINVNLITKVLFSLLGDLIIHKSEFIYTLEPSSSKPLLHLLFIFLENPFISYIYLFLVSPWLFVTHPLTWTTKACGLNIMFVYILFHICIWSMIYIIVPNLSCLGVSSQVGKGYYQQFTLLRVDVLSLGQILAVNYCSTQLQGHFLPSFSYAQLWWNSALMQMERSVSVLLGGWGGVWHGNH